MDYMAEVEDAVTQQDDGVHLNLFVTSGAKTTKFPAGFNSWRRRIEIKVEPPAKDNKANAEVLTTIASFFGVPERKVFIIQGEKRRTKTILLKEVSGTLVTQKLRESLHGL
ncbi:MAG: YggU family protein [Candidatus Thermoplasmatota archaeon]|nr:YggU family protein [Candidatus Thermoplasmatota archaeon]